MGDSEVVRRWEPDNSGALVSLARGQGNLAEIFPLRDSAPMDMENDRVIVKRVGRLNAEEGSWSECERGLDGARGKIYTLDPKLQGRLLSVQNYTRTPDGEAQESRPKIVIESADLNDLPDEVGINVIGMRREMMTLGELRRQKWNIQYVVLLDSYAAEQLDIPDSASMPYHVNVEIIDGVPRRVLVPMGAAYIDAEVSVHY